MIIISFRVYIFHVYLPIIRTTDNSIHDFMFKPSSNFLTDHSNEIYLLWIRFVICLLCHTFSFDLCSLVVTCWERADILALVYVTFSCILSHSHMVSWVRYGI